MLSVPGARRSLGRVVGLEKSRAKARKAARAKGRSARSLAARQVLQHPAQVQSLRQSPAILRLCPRPVY